MRLVSAVAGGANLHQLHLHWHADGEEHPDGVGLPQDQGVLQGEARARVPGIQAEQFHVVHCTAACMAEYQTNCAAQVLNQETRNNILENNKVEFFFFRDQKMIL